MKHNLFTIKSKNRPRGRIIANSGYLFIGINFLLGLFNIIVGIISGSIAITSDALHSFIDSLSGFIIILSEKLASHHRFTAKRVKIERATTIIIALIIIIVGAHIMIDAVCDISTPESPDYNIPTIVVLLASITLKYLLATYLKNTGKAVKSTVLVASGAETMNDAWISIAVLISALIYMIWQVDIEAYISIIISIIIFKVGLEFIFPHISHHHHHHLEQDPDHDHCNKKIR